MKAIRVNQFGGIECLRVVDVAELFAGPEEIVVSVKAAGVNPVDTYIRGGMHSIKPPLPFTPGFDAAGIILRVGSNVKEWLPGQRVYVSLAKSGTYAEQCSCTRESVHLLPEHISFEQGAALGIPYLTAYRALFQIAKARPGETVLIHGASGSVGLAAVQFARARGLRALGTSSTDKGRELILHNGAHHALSHGSDEMRTQIRAITDGAGPDVILEMLANENLADDLKMVAKQGRIVVVGNRGVAQINMRDAMSKDVAVLSMFIFNAPADEIAEAHAAIGAILEAKTFRPPVGVSFQLEDAADAHEAVIGQPGGAAGKILLII